MTTPSQPRIVNIKKESDEKFVVTIFDGSTQDFKTESDAIEAAKAVLKAIHDAMPGPKLGIIDME